MKIKELKDMTLKEKIGQLILPGFKSLEYDESINTLVEDYSVGNVLLFTRNFESAEQVRKLCTTIHEKIIKKTGIIPFIAIDQEGGQVTRMMKDVTFAPGAMTSSASSVEDATYKTAKILGADMISLGMNLDLAPVLDVCNNLNNPVINVRSFSSDKDRVAECGKRYIKGLAEYGVLGCAKHFPGHGDTAVDSHLGLPTITHDMKRIHEIELYPFMNNLDVPCIMSAHVIFKAYDDVPATLSKKVLQGVLREELGYQGIIISDCLEMKAIQDHYGTAEGAVMALKAGIDLLDISHTLELQTKALDLIYQAVMNGEITEDAIDQKVARILKYKKQTLASLEKYFYNTSSYVHNLQNDKISQDIVDKSLTIFKGKNVEIDNKTLIIGSPAIARTIIEDEFDDRDVIKAIKGNINASLAYYNKTAESASELLNEANNYQKVLFFSYNAATDSVQVDLINQLINKFGDNLYVISMKGPLDYYKYPNLNNYACVYEYTPNSVKTIIKYLKGEIKPLGSSPIKL